MTKTIHQVIACAILVSTRIAHGAEGPAESPDLSSRVSRSWTSYVINKDGTYSETEDVALKVLKEQAIPRLKQSSVSFSTGIQTAEVLAAYTLKADGRRIDVPKSNYQQEVNSGHAQGEPVYSDITTLTVVFPDVEVGDELVFNYRLIAKEPIYPNHFSVLDQYAKTAPFDDVKVSFDYPADLWVQYRMRGMQEITNTTKADRKIIEWAYKNPNPAKSKRRDYSVYDIEKETGYEFSTFHSYADVAHAYGERAIPKAVVTERVQSLANEIAGNEKAPRDVARRLYDWVATNITYAGNCIGLGAVVPHDTNFILDNRMGDCKDHATLLQALLAAKRITSDQALVNSSSVFRLNKIPVVSAVNHVINYIPSLDLYVDSTSTSTPFGMLPMGDAGKPVLLVSNYKEGTMTPSPPPGTNVQTTKTALEIQADGSIKADVKVGLKGHFAAWSRSRMRQLSRDNEAELIPNAFKGSGHIASGSFSKEDPKALLDSYQYSAKFEVQNLIPYPGTGAFPIGPLFYSEAPIAGYIAGALQHDDEADETACTNGKTIEDYEIKLPKTMKVLSIPDNLKLTNDFLSYEATYALKGNRLLVHRVMDDRTNVAVCSRKMGEQYREFALKVANNLKAQVLYK